jgi:hypothetical protein
VEPEVKILLWKGRDLRPQMGLRWYPFNIK